MKKKIGVFGSGVNETSEVTQKARELGKALAENKVIVITGGGPGIPYLIASEAHKNSAEVWGFSTAKDIESHKKAYPHDDYTVYTKLTYIPDGYEFIENLDVCRKYRNVTSTATCNAGIIISGRWGTLNEFTNLYDMGKVIGILTETGGVADEIQTLSQKIQKPGKARLIFNSSPLELVQNVIVALKHE